MFRLLFFLIHGVIRIVVIIFVAVIAVSYGTEALAELENQDWRQMIREIDKPVWLSTPEGDLRLPNVEIKLE